MKNLFVKIFLFAAVLAMGIGMASCGSGDAEQKLRDDVYKSNLDLPHVIDEGVTMEKIKYDGDVLTFTYTLASYYGLLDEDELEELCENITHELVANKDKDVVDLRDMARDAKCDIKVVVNVESGNTASETLEFGEY